MTSTWRRAVFPLSASVVVFDGDELGEPQTLLRQQLLGLIQGQGKARAFHVRVFGHILVHHPILLEQALNRHTHNVQLWAPEG